MTRPHLVLIVQRRRWSSGEDHAGSDRVNAIKLLQYLGLAICEKADENALFIAHAREEVPLLVAWVLELEARVRELEAALARPREKN